MKLPVDYRPRYFDNLPVAVDNRPHLQKAKHWIHLVPFIKDIHSFSAVYFCKLCKIQINQSNFFLINHTVSLYEGKIIVRWKSSSFSFPNTDRSRGLFWPQKCVKAFNEIWTSAMRTEEFRGMVSCFLDSWCSRFPLALYSVVTHLSITFSGENARVRKEKCLGCVLLCRCSFLCENVWIRKFCAVVRRTYVASFHSLCVRIRTRKGWDVFSCRLRLLSIFWGKEKQRRKRWCPCSPLFVSSLFSN